MKSSILRLMCLLAHPDDEAMGTGGLLAKYAAEGVETSLVTATRGQRGWFGDPDAYPGPEALGELREAELRASAAVLGLRTLTLLDYYDGALDQAPAAEVLGRLVAEIRRLRPQVVVTFDPFGFYGHPDHIVISQLAAAALPAAADPDYACASDAPPHRVAKLYYLAPDEQVIAACDEAFGGLSMEIDGQLRTTRGWPGWAITTHIDATAYWRQAWQAVACHRSQLPEYERLAALPDELHARL